MDLSSYNYCSNNPILRIDPNGALDTDFGLDKNGHIKQIGETNNDPDRLFATDDKGEKTDVNGDGKVGEQDYVQVNDKSILPGLTKEASAKIGSVSKASANKNGSADIINVFKFAAKNSSAEWRLDRFNLAGEDNFMVSTLHRTDYSPSSRDIGLSESSIKAFMHSHPGEPNDISSERFSMGDNGITKGAFIGNSDYSYAIWRFYNNNNKEPYPSFNYFPVSGRKYQITPYGINIVHNTISNLINGK